MACNSATTWREAGGICAAGLDAGIADKIDQTVEGGRSDLFEGEILFLVEAFRKDDVIAAFGQVQHSAISSGGAGRHRPC